MLIHNTSFYSSLYCKFFVWSWCLRCNSRQVWYVLIVLLITMCYQLFEFVKSWIWVTMHTCKVWCKFCLYVSHGNLLVEGHCNALIVAKRFQSAPMHSINHTSKSKWAYNRIWIVFIFYIFTNSTFTSIATSRLD